MSERKHKVLIVHNYYQIPGGEDTVVANEKKLLEDQHLNIKIILLGIRFFWKSLIQLKILKYML